MVETDDHAAGLGGGFVEAVGGVVEDGYDGVGGVFAHEARVVLHGEVQTVLAFEITGLAAFGSRAAESPDYGAVCGIDAVDCADMASRYHVIAGALRFCDRVDMAGFR